MANISQIKTGISLLKWQVPKGKINPKALGYVCPNGTINFQTAETAQTYAKNRVLSALQAPKPFERAVSVEDSRIIGDINGTVHKVEFDSKNLLNGHNDVTLVHGHPIGTPLSDQVCKVQFFAPKFLIADIFITIIGHSGHFDSNYFRPFKIGKKLDCFGRSPSQ